MTDTETESVAPETKAWAHRVMDGLRGVQALHQPQTFWEVDDGSDRVFDSLGEAEEYVATFDAPAVIESFVYCTECARVESGEEYGEASAWPCATALAGGFAQGPLL